ncbi:transmembrane and death domain protein 1-like [Alosa sapidissima]|uniref:transmembrane and death domain protein 1-like n=1 Tax=Alosa sapidissima TaxID=34773 RepID=UPI001C089E83|nr:transmembrane and death domain protein 1-like [Alosa sapidissima]
MSFGKEKRKLLQQQQKKILTKIFVATSWLSVCELASSTLSLSSPSLSSSAQSRVRTQLQASAEPNESPRLFCWGPAVAERPLCPLSLLPSVDPLLLGDRALTVPPFARPRTLLVLLAGWPAAVAEDLGSHQLERLVELLTLRECQDLRDALARPEEDVLAHIQRLSLENNDLGLGQRQRRDASASDSEAECHSDLTDWLQIHGEQMYYDRLSGALQQIGRTDIAIEVAKNINQAKALSLQHYVDEYHSRIEQMALEDKSAIKEQHTHTVRSSVRRLRDLTWRDLELVVERKPVPPNPRGLLDGVWPLAYGLLLGFSSAFVMSVSTLLMLCICNRAQRDSAGCSKRRKSGHLLRDHRDGGLLTSVVTSSEMATQELQETPLLIGSE